MNGKQARLLLDGAYAFTEHIPMTSEEHMRRTNAYTVLKEIINLGYPEEYPTEFEKYMHPEEWSSYQSRRAGE